MEYQIISDREILQRAGFDCGPRVTREQIVEVNGMRFECKIWTNASGRVVNVESNAI